MALSLQWYSLISSSQVKEKNVQQKIAVDVSDTSSDIDDSEDDKELKSDVDAGTKEVKTGDYVTVTRGPFRGYYTLVTEKKCPDCVHPGLNFSF